MTKARHRSRGGDASFIVSLIASTFLMGSSFIAGKILPREGFPPTLLVGWRFLVAALATLPLFYFDSHRCQFGSRSTFGWAFGVRECVITIADPQSRMERRSAGYVAEMPVGATTIGLRWTTRY